MAFRSIKDTVPISESLSALGDFAERLYWRMLAKTDTYGRLPGRATKIKALCMPLVAGASAERIQEAMRELREAGRITLYWVADQPYIFLNDFDEHQPAEFKKKRGKATYPTPPGFEEQPREPTPTERLAGLTAPATTALTPEAAALSPATAAAEESRGEESRENQAPASRPRDVVWDALGELFGPIVGTGKTNARAKRNKANTDLKALGCTTAEQVYAAYKAWPKVFPDMPRCPTDQALATHYPVLAMEGSGGSGVTDAARSWFETVGRELPRRAFDEELQDWMSKGLNPDTAAEFIALFEAAQVG